MGSKERILKVETETESEAETETEKAVCEKEAASKVKHLAEQGAAVTADPSVPCKRFRPLIITILIYYNFIKLNKYRLIFVLDTFILAMKWFGWQKSI